MRDLKPANLVGRLLIAILFLALGVASMNLFMRVFDPKPRPQEQPPYVAYDREQMFDALQPANIRTHLDAIAKFGSRFLGQPGFYATEDYIRRAYEAAGLELHELDNITLAPHTVRREILNATGQALPNVEVFPFFPNHFQPMVTPPAGLTGELVLLDDDTLLKRANFDGCIGLVNLANPSKSYGANWERYAQLGVRALIVAHPGRFEAISSDQWVGLSPQLVSNDPINFTRLAANGPIFSYTNQTITLHVRTEYRPVPHHTLVGVLRAKQKNSGALVITSNYDAFSMLPDRAPGISQACSVAEQLALLKGLLPHRDTLRRDIIFVSTGGRMMACDGDNQLLAALGPDIDRAAAHQRLLDEQERHNQQLPVVEKVAGVVARPEFRTETDPLAALNDEARAFFDEQLRYVLNTIVLEQSEETLQAKLDFLRDPTQDLAGVPYRGYLAAKTKYDQAFATAGYNFNRLRDARRDFVEQYDVYHRIDERLRELLAYHQLRQKQLTQRLALNDLVRGYATVVMMSPELTPRDGAPDQPEQLSFHMGRGTPHRKEGPNIGNLMLASLHRLKLGTQASVVTHVNSHDNDMDAHTAEIPLSARIWNKFYYPSFAVINTDRKTAYTAYYSPLELPFMRNTESMRASLQVMGEFTLSLAYGNGKFNEPLKLILLRYTGKVYVSGIGESVVPNYPLKNGIVGVRALPNAVPGTFQSPGHFRWLLLPTNPYGEYELVDSPADYNAVAYTYTPIAAGWGNDGVLAYMKDDGPTAQGIYKSVALHAGAPENVHMITFRAGAITALDLINPQTMKPYSGAEFVSAASLAPLPKSSIWQTGGPTTAFLPPDERFYVLFKAGTAESELVQTIRAVMLGAPSNDRRSQTQEISGEGYLVADSSFLLDIPAQMAQSMITLNSKRLGLLEARNMADERTVAFQKKATELFKESQQPETPKHETILQARDSTTYSILNYPVIRNTIFDAVYGILWYLGLLVPFAFFFEKLVCGFSDIRKQLTANAVIFLVVFALLKFLHPAFGMIRSSLMILLGFIILLISLGVILLLSGRFQENLEALRRKRGQVSAAEVNKLGVLGTAFALGLNNMHRRKVRTGLTCLTLVLITFAMLCFTTLQSNVVDSATATGKAPYQGILVRPDAYFPISPAEEFAINVKYGNKYRVAPRTMLVGTETWGREPFNPQLNASRDVEGDARKVAFDSILFFSPNEPIAPRIKFLATRGWWTEAELKAGSPRLPVMIPDAMARKLAITPEAVQNSEPVMQINGREFVVRGIFDAEAFGATKDLNNRDFLPFDATARSSTRNTGGGRFWELLAEDDDPRLSPQNVVLAPNVDLGIGQPPNSYLRTVSIAVVMDQLNYKEAKEEIGQYLEQTGKPTYYGLDGISYLGKRYRETSMAGLLDLIIPLFIASITVLNTMRGSVYERRDEIFVYNAVGIAPRHIFFMFMAEALVYAVVGTVLGYLLAQGTGTVLTALDLTGGVQMNFTSKLTIYVSLTIIIATLVSTFFPARSALAIAAPAEESGWKLPEPDGDTLSFNLPFTFRYHGRVAILAFFHRYFQDHGEGSAGSFFASPPQLAVRERDNAYVPQISTTIWLKPFDLGVSQQMIIDLLPDPETKENVARITLQRQSGTKEAWLRLNYTFVSEIRKHFLHWRAVPQDQRDELFAEAKQLLEESTQSHAPANV